MRFTIDQSRLYREDGWILLGRRPFRWQRHIRIAGPWPFLPQWAIQWVKEQR